MKSPIYKEMKDKYDYMQGFSVDSKTEIAKTLAAFGAFTEGLQLFASFAILLNFPRFNKMKGMGQNKDNHEKILATLADKIIVRCGTCSSVSSVDSLDRSGANAIYNK